MLGDMAEPDDTVPPGTVSDQAELQRLLQRIADLALNTGTEPACRPTCTVHTSSGVATVIWFRRRRESRDARLIHLIDGGDDDG